MNNKLITVQDALNAMAVMVVGLQSLPPAAVLGEVSEDGEDIIIGGLEDGIVEGSLADDGSVLLEGWQRAIKESSGGDKWERKWAAQTNRLDRFMIADTLKLDLTERQHFNVSKNLEHAGLRMAMWGFDVNATDVEKRGASEFAFEMTPNESGLGQASSSPIPGVASFGTKAKASEAYEYAQIARRKWIEGQPGYVSETTGIVYGKPAPKAGE